MDSILLVNVAVQRLLLLHSDNWEEGLEVRGQPDLNTRLWQVYSSFVYAMMALAFQSASGSVASTASSSQECTALKQVWGHPDRALLKTQENYTFNIYYIMLENS